MSVLGSSAKTNVGNKSTTLILKKMDNCSDLLSQF